MKRTFIAFIAALLLISTCACTMMQESVAEPTPAAAAPEPTAEPTMEPEPTEAPVVIQYMTAADLYKMILAGEDKVIIDIQPRDYYDAGHIAGSIATYAYPADSDTLKAFLAAQLDSINASDAPVIIVGIGGKTGAENAYLYYVESGVPADRLFILEGGIMHWDRTDVIWRTLVFNYITPDELITKLDKDEDSVMLIDVRQPEFYEAGHLENTIPTSSFPNMSREQWDALDALAEQIKSTKKPIVVICMSGQKGAVNAISYYDSIGIDPGKFLILEGGGKGWPYPEMLISDIPEETPVPDESAAPADTPAEPATTPAP